MLDRQLHILDAAVVPIALRQIPETIDGPWPVLGQVLTHGATECSLIDLGLDGMAERTSIIGRPLSKCHFYSACLVLDNFESVRTYENPTF